MAKNFDIGEYSIEVSRFGNQAESTFSWTVYTAGRTVASGRAEGPHEAEAAGRAVVHALMGTVEMAPVVDLNERLTVIANALELSNRGPCSVHAGRSELTRWQRVKAWFKGKIEDARLRIRYQLW